MQLTAFTANVNVALDYGSIIGYVSLYIADVVNEDTHSLPLYKLRALNIDPKVLSWINALFANRSGFVTVNGFDSR